MKLQHDLAPDAAEWVFPGPIDGALEVTGVANEVMELVEHEAGPLQANALDLRAPCVVGGNVNDNHAGRW